MYFFLIVVRNNFPIFPPTRVNQQKSLAIGGDGE